MEQESKFLELAKTLVDRDKDSVAEFNENTVKWGMSLERRLEFVEDRLFFTLRALHRTLLLLDESIKGREEV